MKTPESPRRKARTTPQRHNRNEKEKYATPRQNLKRKLQDIVLGREEKTEWWSTWEYKLLNIAECHVIGRINNK